VIHLSDLVTRIWGTPGYTPSSTRSLVGTIFACLILLDTV